MRGRDSPRTAMISPPSRYRFALVVAASRELASVPAAVAAAVETLVRLWFDSGCSRKVWVSRLALEQSQVEQRRRMGADWLETPRRVWMGADWLETQRHVCMEATKTAAGGGDEWMMVKYWDDPKSYGADVRLSIACRACSSSPTHLPWTCSASTVGEMHLPWPSSAASSDVAALRSPS